MDIANLHVNFEMYTTLKSLCRIHMSSKKITSRQKNRRIGPVTQQKMLMFSTSWRNHTVSSLTLSLGGQSYTLVFSPRCGLTIKLVQTLQWGFHTCAVLLGHGSRDSRLVFQDATKDMHRNVAVEPILNLGIQKKILHLFCEASHINIYVCIFSVPLEPRIGSAEHISSHPKTNLLLFTYRCVKYCKTSNDHFFNLCIDQTRGFRIAQPRLNQKLFSKCPPKSAHLAVP